MRKTTTILASVAVCVSTLFSSCQSSSDDFYEDVDLLPVQLSKDGKWSFINEKGEVVYDSEFKNRPAMVVGGVFSVVENDALALYKASDKKPEIVPGCDSLCCAGVMSEGVIPVVKPNQRITLIDEDGKTVSTLNPIGGKEIERCGDRLYEGLLPVKTEDGLWGYVDKTGKPAIKPYYDDCGPFKDGLAVVATKTEKKDTTIYSHTVIDKSGKTVFKLKDSYSLVYHTFIKGSLLVKDDDRYLVLDKKGEAKKLASQIKWISYFNGKYVIFRSEDDQYGVADLNGEIIIRPKYASINFLSDDTFAANRESTDNSTLVLDEKGEQINDLDYKGIKWLGKFGCLASEGKSAVLLDNDFKPKTKDDYYDVSLVTSSYNIVSDYYDVNIIIEKALGLISAKGVGEISVDGSPLPYLKSQNKEPRDFSYKYSFTYDSQSVQFLGSTISVSVNTDSYIATSDGWGGYAWNDCKVVSINISIDAKKNFGKEGFAALSKALEKKGWKKLKEISPKDHSEDYVLFKKGNLLALTCSDLCRQGVIVLYPASQEQMFLERMKYMDNSAYEADGAVADSDVVYDDCDYD